MDTRTKIVAWAQFAQTKGPVVAGYFDPMVVDHSARLEELAAKAGKLNIALYDPPQPLLPAAARAALVAALACVESVAIAEGEVPGAIDLRTEDLDRRQSLIAHVHSKHGR